MSRTYIWQYLLDETGEPLSGVEVFITDMSNIDVPIYELEAGGAPITNSRVVTNDRGFFSFWVPDTYTQSERIKIKFTWEYNGISFLQENVEFPRHYAGADQTSTNTVKNKLVSNEQMKYLYDRVDALWAEVFP